MQYLSYADYQSMGGTASNTAFTLLEYKARMMINKITRQRLVADTTVQEPVKMLTYELVDIHTTDQNGKTITSESSGSYSVSYDVSKLSNDTKDLIKSYLNGVKNQAGENVLYMGVD